jgi:hypothetical protein
MAFELQILVFVVFHWTPRTRFRLADARTNFVAISLAQLRSR